MHNISIANLPILSVNANKCKDFFRYYGMLFLLIFSYSDVFVVF